MQEIKRKDRNTSQGEVGKFMTISAQNIACAQGCKQFQMLGLQTVLYKMGFAKPNTPDIIVLTPKAKLVLHLPLR
jgi:hypothetical protein